MRPAKLNIGHLIVPMYPPLPRGARVSNARDMIVTPRPPTHRRKRRTVLEGERAAPH